MSCKVKMLAASQSSSTGAKLITWELRYWRAIHSELMTHRAFSRNAGSSRAIPVRKVLAQVWSDPAGPIHWGVNQAGMKARAELVGWRLAAAGALWRAAGKVMCGFAWGMVQLNLHKQVANRILEPWQYINVVVSATEVENFFALRCHPDAQPEFQELAEEMKLNYDGAVWMTLQPGEWHMPYVLGLERGLVGVATSLKLSAARTARVSYEPFDGNGSLLKEVERHDLLVGSEPIHASPTEHQAVCTHGSGMFANFSGFRQYRSFIESKEKVPV